MRYATALAVAPDEEEGVIWLREDKPSYGRQPPRKKAPKLSRYIDFRTDFAFKRLLRGPGCEKRLQSLVNALTKNNRKAGQLTFLDPGINAKASSNRKAAFDILCKDRFRKCYIIEMQRRRQVYFIDRSFYYRAVFVTDSAPKGDWDYNLAIITMICFLDFKLRPDSPNYIHTAMETYLEDHELTNNKLLKIFIELCKFTKALDDLETEEDLWLYLIKNLSDMEEMPKQYDTDLFRPIFEQAEFLKLNETEQMNYQEEQTMSWDNYAELTTARTEEEIKGKLEAEMEGKREFVEYLLLHTDHSPYEIVAIVRVPLLMVLEIRDKLFS